MQAMRGLRRSPGFAGVAILTLALGIGANTTMFSMVYGLLLRPLPYPSADRLVTVTSSVLTADNVAAFGEAMRTFERMATYGIASSTMNSPLGAEQVRVLTVSDAFLPMLGVSPAAGRFWSPAEHDPAAAPTAVVSQRLWDATRAGTRTITLQGKVYDVIGAVPAGFEFMRYRGVEIWVPSVHWTRPGLGVLALLRSGVAVQQAGAEADAFAQRQPPVRAAADMEPFARVHRLSDVLWSDVRGPLYVLFAAAGFVLLIGCANVANLLLARATGRLRETGVRVALGATRSALMRQQLVESAVLAGAAGAAGVLIAWWAGEAILALLPLYIPRIDEVAINIAVVGFALVASFATVLLAGVAPAAASARRALRAMALEPGRTTASSGSRRTREALVALEVALALVLVIGTLLLVRTFMTLRPASPGFAIEDRIVGRLALHEGDDADLANVEFVRRLLDGLARAGATRSAVVTDLPLTGESMLLNVTAVDGESVTGANGRPLFVHFRSATPEYFDVVQLAPVRGRALAAPDLAGAPLAIVLNESAVRRLWPDGDEALGRVVSIDVRERMLDFTIVGVVPDTRIHGGTSTASAEMWVSYWQVPMARVRLIVHAPAGSGVNAESARQAVAAADPTIPFSDVTTFEAIAAGSVAAARFAMTLMSTLGGLALALALIGSYAVLAFAVAQRTREIGIRIALGATRAAVIRRVLVIGMTPVAAGIAIGIGLALALTRLLESSLYGVSPTDPATFAGAAGALALAALAATLIPARRAVRLDPSYSLNVS